jgi:hypothetical protein
MKVNIKYNHKSKAGLPYKSMLKKKNTWIDIVLIISKNSTFYFIPRVRIIWDNDISRISIIIYCSGGKKTKTIETINVSNWNTLLQRRIVQKTKTKNLREGWKKRIHLNISI